MKPFPVRTITTKKDLKQSLTEGALHAAPKLLGCRLVIEKHSHLEAMIVETEAYTVDDPASHTFGGKTNRNQSMFKKAGHAYLYRSYGIHTCFNIVTGEEGIGEAVLVRAVWPLQGLEQMIKNRGWSGKPLNQLVNGPGKLCQALGLSLEMDGLDLLAKNTFRLEPALAPIEQEVYAAPRIGISKAKEKLWRFYIKRPSQE